MSFTVPFLTAYASYVKNRFIRKTGQVIAAQEHFLRELLLTHQETELGSKFGLRDIKTIDQFRQQVPIWTYADYEPYTQRIAQGEPNILNSDPVEYINLTSGSTGKKKQVPVTRRFQQTLRRADLAAMGFALEGLRKRHLQFGKFLITNSVQIQGKTPAGIEYGPVSVGSIRRGKPLFEQLFTQPFSTLEISDTLTRHYVCLLFALRNAHLRGMAANFPMLILRTCGYLERYAEELIHDLENGTITPHLPIEPEIRAALEKRWSAAPKRAAQLRTILKQEGRLTPYRVWPGLSYITTARGGTSGFYLERFPDYFGDTPVFGGVYGTAEATFSVYLDLGVDASALAIESGFFEFVPMDQWDSPHPKTLLPNEVTVGDRYRILATTYSGFYRYDIGDVVEVTGFYNQTPCIIFRHRQGGLLSSTTEKTTEFHVIQVMQQLQEEFNLHLDDFCITLTDHEFPARYLVNIELADGQTLERPQQFLRRFEYWMQEFNNPYGTVRQGQVPPPRLRILAPGSFTRLRQRYIERGMFDSQLKIPHISEDRNFLIDLAVLQEFDLEPEISVGSLILSASKPFLGQPPSSVSPISHGSSPTSIDPSTGQVSSSSPRFFSLTEPLGLKMQLQVVDVRSLRGTLLVRADLRGMDLSGADLAHADLSGANLQAANLSRANLTGAYLREANLQGANLNDAILREADLTKANLSTAQLKNSDFTGAYLTHTNLEKADLTQSQFNQAFLWHTNFQGAALSGATFQDAQIRQAHFSNCEQTHN